MFHTIIIYYIILTLIGLVIGSFLNVCISRLPSDSSIIFPASHCPKCKKPLKFFDLIPVLSFLMLKGRCRYCGSGISTRYPIVEILTAIILLVFHFKFGLSIKFFVYSLFFLDLLVLGMIDIENLEIPDFLMLAGVVLGLLYSFRQGRMFDTLAGISFAFVFLFILSQWAKIFTGKEALGEGDIKLAVMIASLLGLNGVFISIFAASVVGSISGIALIMSGKMGRKDYIPFGPFLAIGALVAVFI